MTTFPPFPGSNEHGSQRRSLRSERYAFQINEKHYTLQFLPTTYLDGYDDRQLAALNASRAYEVAFRLEDFTLPDGSVIAGYGSMGTGNAFQVLGGVANGIADWAQQRRPDFLYWQVHGVRRQRLYERMIRYFAARGSGWHRLPMDPFTGLRCQPEAFWLRHTSFCLESTTMPDPTNDPDSVLAFCRESKAGSLVDIRHEAEAAGIDITDEQIRRLILAPRAAGEPEFDIEVYKHHL